MKVPTTNAFMKGLDRSVSTFVKATVGEPPAPGDPLPLATERVQFMRQLILNMALSGAVNIMSDPVKATRFALSIYDEIERTRR